MQSERSVSKEKPMAEVREKIVSRTIREITPFGVRIDLNVEGTTSGELYTAQHIETVSLFQKLDGTFESEARAIETTEDGQVIVIMYRGTGRQTGVTTMWGESEGVIMTQSEKFAQLNGAKIKTEVNADIATNEVVVKYHRT